MIDISVLVRVGTPEWPGDAAFCCGWTLRIADGAPINLSVVSGSPHVGTHADAPLHVRDDWPASECLDLSAFLGACRVIDVRDSPAGVLDLAADDVRLRDARRIILRTGRSIVSGEFPEAWPALAPEVAGVLVERGMDLLAVDCPSVDERESKSLSVHHAVFSRGAFILENLDLRNAPEGDYELVALPQRLEGLEAAPVRAVLFPIPEGEIASQR